MAASQLSSQLTKSDVFQRQRADAWFLGTYQAQRRDRGEEIEGSCPSWCQLSRASSHPFTPAARHASPLSALHGTFPTKFTGVSPGAGRPNTVTSCRQLLTPGVPGGYWWQKAGGGRRRPAPSRCTNSPGVLGCQGSTLLPTYHHCTDSHSFTIAEKRLTLSQLCVALLFPQDFWRPADLVSQALQ